MNQSKIDQFWQFYEEDLRKRVQKNFQEYGYPVERVPEVVAKMKRAYAGGPFKINLGPSWKAAAKKMGHTSSKKLWAELYGE